MKESREKFLDRYRAISSASTEASVAGDSSVSPSSSTQIDLTVSNEDIRLSVREVMRREWESLREEESGLPQLPSSRASKEEYMEQVSNLTVCMCSFVYYHRLAMVTNVLIGPNLIICCFVAGRALMKRATKWSMFSASWTNSHRS